MTLKKEIENMSWKEFERVAHRYPYKLPRIFSVISDDALLTTKDISELIGITEETVRNWIRRGRLRVNSPIGKYLVAGEDLKEFMFERFRKDFLSDET